jgi:hypothetical protein
MEFYLHFSINFISCIKLPAPSVNKLGADRKTPKGFLLVNLFPDSSLNCTLTGYNIHFGYSLSVRSQHLFPVL